jgi:hypothetical protein
MGLLDGLIGNASEVDAAKMQTAYTQILMPGERIEKAYKLVRDTFFFTDKRMVVVDKQGVTGNKIEYHSIPYRSITRFSVETAGHFDLDAELKIWITGASAPLTQQFTKSVNVYQVQSLLAAYALR